MLNNYSTFNICAGSSGGSVGSHPGASSIGPPSSIGSSVGSCVSSFDFEIQLLHHLLQSSQEDLLLNNLVQFQAEQICKLWVHHDEENYNNLLCIAELECNQRSPCRDDDGRDD